MKKAKYLFFDIECSNGYNICSFGYCLISEELKVLAKKDVIINPENKFILAQKGKRPKIELAYPEEYFYKQDNFSAFYDDIKKLLCGDLVLLGHSVQSDFHFLKYACDRYNLPHFDIKAYDTQLIFKNAFHRAHVESLEKILEFLEFDTDRVTFHKSCDDALASFYVAREVCEIKGQTLEELLKESENCLVESKKLEETPKIKQKPKRNCVKTVDKK